MSVGSQARICEKCGIGPVAARVEVNGVKHLYCKPCTLAITAKAKFVEERSASGVVISSNFVSQLSVLLLVLLTNRRRSGGSKVAQSERQQCWFEFDTDGNSHSDDDDGTCRCYTVNFKLWWHTVASAAAAIVRFGCRV
jgi:hypothetical protein